MAERQKHHRSSIRRFGGGLKLAYVMVGFAMQFGAVAAAFAQCASPGVGRDSECLANGVILHYVDWGGSGDDVVLLAGLDDSARIYDELAPLLAQHHHVIAVTRRGFGHSAIPPDGYDGATLTADLREFIKALRLKSVNLVGHSISGLEMTRLATSDPELVRRVVYLDAATDKSPLAGISEKDPLGPRDPPQRALKNFASLTAWAHQLLRSQSPAIESNLRQCYDDTQSGLIFRTPPAIDAAVAASMFADRPNYSGVLAPALAIYSDYQRADQVPPGTSMQVRITADAFARAVYTPWQELEAARFRQQIACGSILMLNHTGHYLFLERPLEIAHWINSFLSSTSPCSFVCRISDGGRPLKTSCSSNRSVSG